MIRRRIQQCRSIPRGPEQCPGVDEPGTAAALVRDGVRVAVKEVIDAVIDRILHHPGQVAVREGDPLAVNFSQSEGMIDADADQFSIMRQGLLVPVAVPKDDPRVEAYGAVDELNSVIGVAVSVMRRRRLISVLQGIQNELFNVGSELASAGAKRAEVAALFTDAERKIAALEALTDEYDGKVPALRTFILPGGSQAGALL
ncbi:MAG: ATP:cob(I)alamin adenosyltransferase, partial [Planctomycetes bacterium]|nr:ATP:cob(I)alamin adenosyltransferase [Planctomycetota bacterium]